MPTVRAERTIGAPIEQVFDRLTDHASYKDFPGVRASELIHEGQPDRNGLGAMRRIEFGPIRFEEEIMAFDRPRRMDYLIREVNIPMKHEGGRMEFEAVEGGTRVVWTSTFTGSVPGIGGAVGSALGPSVRMGFNRILRFVDRQLSQPGADQRLANS